MNVGGDRWEVRFNASVNVGGDRWEVRFNASVNVGGIGGRYMVYCVIYGEMKCVLSWLSTREKDCW